MKVNNKKGFTLIELLIVVVIIGILAAIAIPKFAATKEKAYVATMKTDLKNLATAEEGYASSNAGAYMPAGAYTSAAAVNNYQPSAGVTVTVPAPIANGWKATATSTNTTKKCYIFSGLETSPNAAMAPEDGVPGCDP